MKGVVWHGPYDIRVESLPLPQIQAPHDAIVRVTRTAICGTDLHPYRGEIEDFQRATVMGHEFTGVVEELGPAVTRFQRGDRVLASDIIACGACWYCWRGWHYQCQEVSLFGYGNVVGAYVPGGQAEYVRVPFADTVLSPILPPLTDEQALFIGDILTTGYTCAVESQLQPGDTVAVVGCGPVGLFAAMSAYLLGASRVLAIDPDPRRCAAAEQIGGWALVPDDDLEERVRSLSGGRGVDVVLEAVGSEQALTTALAIVRPKGVISAVGAHHAMAMPFPTKTAFGRELTLRFSVGDPIRWREPLTALVAAGRLDPTRIISHRLSLAAATEGYRLFDRREATKVVLIP
jgi:threonine dehydrogenase-like Zn-dependent dehydrogenase